MTIKVNGNLTQEEVKVYVQQIREKYPERQFKTIELTADGDFVDVKYTYDEVPFDRIRRITGYLVGTMDNWNDAKTAEEKDRVKHSIGGCGAMECL